MPDNDQTCDMCDENFSKLIDFEIEPGVLLNICKNCFKENMTSDNRARDCCSLCGNHAAYSDARACCYCKKCFEKTFDG